MIFIPYIVIFTAHINKVIQTVLLILPGQDLKSKHEQSYWDMLEQV